MKPICWFRNLADCLCDKSEIDLSITMAVPSEGVSSEPIIFNKVVLPEPLGPTKPANSPSPKVRLIWLSAVKCPFPTRNLFTKSLILIISILLYLDCFND